MEEVKQYLQQKAAKAERLAAALDTQVVAHQRAIGEAKAAAAQERAIAAELRRLLLTYGPEEAQDGAATAFSGEGQGVEPTQDEKGVGGREIKHVDVTDVGAVSELPDAVWLPEGDLQAHQIAMASYVQTDVHGGKMYLINTAMLTPEQKAKYAEDKA